MFRVTMQSGYLGWREASEYTGLSATTLRVLVREGKLRAFRPTAQRTLLSREDIDRYMESQQIVEEVG